MAKAKGIVKMLSEQTGKPVSEIKSMIMKAGIAMAKEIYDDKLRSGKPRSRQTWYESLSEGLREAWKQARQGTLFRTGHLAHYAPKRSRKKKAE